MVVMMRQMSDGFIKFVKLFLNGRINWQAVPRDNAIRNFGNIISFVIYRESPYQVELFIVPTAPSSFTEHTHPNVDVIEFGLTGKVLLSINGEPICTEATLDDWQCILINTVPIHIAPTDVHSGKGITPYAFLSLQHWLNGVTPTSVGLNWNGEPSSTEQESMWKTSVNKSSVVCIKR